MTKEDVAELQLLLDDLGVRIWLDGGWAVDAVVGEQTRPHEDLDLLVSSSDLAVLRHALAGAGFQPQQGGREANFVLVDRLGRQVDVHVITLDANGHGTYQMEDGSTWIFTSESLAGRGTVNGVEVRCLSPEEQVRCRDQGYKPREKDLADLRVLGTRLGVDLPARLQAALSEKPLGDSSVSE